MARFDCNCALTGAVRHWLRNCYPGRTT